MLCDQKSSNRQEVLKLSLVKLLPNDCITENKLMSSTSNEYGSSAHCTHRRWKTTSRGREAQTPHTVRQTVGDFSLPSL